MKRLIAIVFLLAIGMLFGCPEVGPPGNDAPNGPELPEPPEILIDSPYNVSVVKDNDSNDIIITWEDSYYNNYYEVERSVGGEDFVLLTEDPIPVKHHRDTIYPPNKDLTYRVRAVRTSYISEFVELSRSIAIPIDQISVQHTYATKLEVKNTIEISWAPLENTEINPAYRIRRYESRESGENTPDVYSVEFVPTPESLSTTINGKLYFTDDAVTDHTPYYYSIHWTNQINNQEGRPSNVVLGMSSEYEHRDSEPNNSLDDIDISRSFLPLPTQELIIFDFLYPEDKDIDWYNYTGGPCNLEVNVSFESGFNLAGNLEFSFLHNGKTYSGGIIKNAFPFSNVFVFPREYFEESSVLEEPVIVSGNMISNGDFTSGTGSWVLDTYEGASANMNNNYSRLNLIIDNGGTIEWHVQLTQTGISLENGKTYLVEFDARSGSTSRTMQVSLGQTSEPYLSYSGYEAISLTPGFTHYSFTFTMTDPSDNNSRIEFNLGTHASDVFIDNISLYEIELQNTEIDPTVQFCIKPSQTSQNIYGIYRVSVEQN